MLKIKVEEPYFIELENEQDYDEVKRQLMTYMMYQPDSQFRHPKMAVVVTGKENSYSMYKELFHEFRIPSQVIRTNNAAKFNMSKASVFTRSSSIIRFLFDK